MEKQGRPPNPDRRYEKPLKETFSDPQMAIAGWLFGS